MHGGTDKSAHTELKGRKKRRMERERERKKGKISTRTYLHKPVVYVYLNVYVTDIMRRDPVTSAQCYDESIAEVTFPEGGA